MWTLMCRTVQRAVTILLKNQGAEQTAVTSFGMRCCARQPMHRSARNSTSGSFQLFRNRASRRRWAGSDRCRLLGLPKRQGYAERLCLSHLCIEEMACQIPDEPYPTVGLARRLRSCKSCQVAPIAPHAQAGFIRGQIQAQCYHTMALQSTVGARAYRVGFQCLPVSQLLVAQTSCVPSPGLQSHSSVTSVDLANPARLLRTSDDETVLACTYEVVRRRYCLVHPLEGIRVKVTFEDHHRAIGGL